MWHVVDGLIVDPDAELDDMEPEQYIIDGVLVYAPFERNVNLVWSQHGTSHHGPSKRAQARRLFALLA